MKPFIKSVGYQPENPFAKAVYTHIIYRVKRKTLDFVELMLDLRIDRTTFLIEDEIDP